jgi:hypothetical protein
MSVMAVTIISYTTKYNIVIPLLISRGGIRRENTKVRADQLVFIYIGRGSCAHGPKPAGTRLCSNLKRRLVT